jgi:endonuclease/exonuclease/phosphatase family metal-dependent hydrolase
MKRDFQELIYRLVREKGLDIIAFQEDKALRSAVLYDVQMWLPGWECSRPSNSEFAFIWNPQRVKECSKDMEPQVFTAYKSDVHLAREPLYGRFEPVHIGPFVEFRLINIHLYHGADKASNEASETLKDINRRQLECSTAKGVIHETIDKGVIHETIDKARYGNFKRAFTIVLGDYNFDCETCNQFGPSNILTFQDEKTTLRRQEPYGYNNSYDHFSFDIEKNCSVPYTVTCVDAVNEYFSGDFERYRRNISDHVPVIIEIF